MATALITAISLIFAYQPDQFQRVVANYYSGSVTTGEAAAVDEFTSEIFAIESRNWLVKRTWGSSFSWTK